MTMKLPESAHTSRPWRIHELTRDFRLEDVWKLPTPGGPADFPLLVQLITTSDLTRPGPWPVRTLFAIRWKLGELLGLDEPDAGPEAQPPTVRDRLPADLREASHGPDPLPFTLLYRLDDEWAAELVNRTVHGVLHLGWVPNDDGGYHGQLAILVKRNGLLGAGYMAAIKPFRYLVVYPLLTRELGRRWRDRAST
jgi:uncharacterized protein DUF2867